LLVASVEFTGVPTVTVPVNALVPFTVTFPPTFSPPATPIPPLTLSAPVELDVEAVVATMLICALDVRPFNVPTDVICD
jgi:hypothetical protein